MKLPLLNWDSSTLKLRHTHSTQSSLPNFLLSISEFGEITRTLCFCALGFIWNIIATHSALIKNSLPKGKKKICLSSWLPSCQGWKGSFTTGNDSSFFTKQCLTQILLKEKANAEGRKINMYLAFLGSEKHSLWPRWLHCSLPRFSSSSHEKGAIVTVHVILMFVPANCFLSVKELSIFHRTNSTASVFHRNNFPSTQ